MLRELLTIFVPLLLPTAIYLVWLWLAHWSRGATGVRWAALPWVWLGAAGALLLGFVLFVVTVHFGTSETGVYVPPRWESGRIIPGHIVPTPKP